jgi:hypothetical protein
MVKLNFDTLEFDHLVEFTKDRTLFAAARENAYAHHLRIFLITEHSVYTRNGRADSWEELKGNEKNRIIAKLCAVRQRIPLYKVHSDGSLPK